MAKILRPVLVYEPDPVSIDEPEPYDTLETWEEHLLLVQDLPDDHVLKQPLLENAREMIAKKKAEGF